MKRRLWLSIGALGVFGTMLVLVTVTGRGDGGSEMAARTSHWLASSVEQTMTRLGTDAAAFTVSDAVRSGDAARLIPFLNALTATYGNTFGEVLVLNRHGKVIGANTVDAEGDALLNDAVFARDLSGSRWFRQAVERASRCQKRNCFAVDTTLEDDELGPLFNRRGKVLSISAPIRHSRSGELLGVWTNRVSWDAVTEPWRAAASHWQGEVALFDGAGSPLFWTGESAFTFRGGTQPHRASGDKGSVWEAASPVPAVDWQAVARIPASGGAAGFWQWLAALLFGTVVGAMALGMREALRSLDQVFFAVNDQADHLKSAASQLTTASQDLAQSASEQAASLQQTASSIDEINSMVNQSAENAERSKGIANHSQETATRGRRVVDDMIRAIGEISTSNGAILKQVEAGNLQLTDIIKVISEIGNKTKIINDIAFQTKLLSFNASVEAARAGEHGKGFAVVAEEVGSLAQMSANAAKEINDMLAGSIQTVNGIVESSRGRVESLIGDGKLKIESGIQVARECEKVLGEIVEAEARMNAIINQIAGAAREQAQGIGEITKAIGMLDSTTHRNSRIAQETEEFADAISQLARDLKLELAEFRRRMNGRGRSPHSHPEAVASPAAATMAEIAPDHRELDATALESIFGTPSGSAPAGAALPATEAASAPAAAAKVIPLRRDEEFSLRSASPDSLEETPSESDPRFKEV